MRGAACQSRAARNKSADLTLSQAAARESIGIGGRGDVGGGLGILVRVHRNGENLLGEALERPEKPARILGGERAADDDKRPLRLVLELRHRLRERAPGVRVMAAVEPNLRAGRGQRRHPALAEVLQAGRPFGPRHALFEGGGREARLDGAQRGDRGRGILMLMAANETRQRQVEKAAFVLEDKAAMFFPCVVIPLRGNQRRASAAGFPLRAPPERRLAGCCTIAGAPGLKIPAFS